MITYAIINTFYIFVAWVLSPITSLSDVSLPSDLINSVHSVSVWITTYDSVFPLSTVFAIIGFLVIIEGGIGFYKLVMWGLRRIPGQG